MNGILGIILGRDGAIRDIGIIANSPEDRKLAQEFLFLVADEIDKFEASMKARLQSIPKAHARPNLSG